MNKIVSIFLIALILSACTYTSQLVKDTSTYSSWIVNALKSEGYKIDYSLNSLKEIDRFFEENSKNGKIVSDGLLSEDLGARMFGIGSYIGEVIRINAGGEWVGDDADPEGEINIQFKLTNGTVTWPMQRAMKRLLNGSEDSIYGYGYYLITVASKS